MILYFIFTDGNNEGLFSLEPSTNVIRLVRELDREAAATHTIMVAASNSPDATNQPLQASILVVNINVNTTHLTSAYLSLRLNIIVIRQPISYTPRT